MRGHYIEARWAHDPTIYAPARFRRACGYRSFVPDDVAGMEVHLTGDLAGAISEAEAAVRSLNGRSEPALAPLARLLLRTESIASSKVEGLQVDGRALARAEVRAETGRKVGSTVGEVIGNIDAMQLAVEDASAVEALTPAHLVGIHAALLHGSPHPGIAGQVREVQNWIGGNDHNPCGAAFVPPPPEHVERLLDDLCRFARADDLPPLVQAAVAHAQFETIHPFVDGNGRTGRALIQVILRRRGLTPSYVPPISVVLARRKERYIDGLTAFREDRVGEWLEQFAVATAQAATLAGRYLDEVAELSAAWRAALVASVGPRADAAAWAVIDVLPAHPVVTVPVAAAATGRSKPGVNQAMEQLVAAGVLVPVSASRRNRAWEADGLLDLLARLEDEG